MTVNHARRVRAKISEATGKVIVASSSTVDTERVWFVTADHQHGVWTADGVRWQRGDVHLQACAELFD